MKVSNISTQNYDVPQYQPKQVNIQDTVEFQQAVEARVSQEVQKQVAKAPIQASTSNGANQDQAPDTEMLEQSLKQANKSLEVFNRHISREMHAVTHAVMYKIIDSKTNEVIAEFPPQKIQDMIAKMWELAGLVVDGKG